jgi:hypothetical protein
VAKIRESRFSLRQPDFQIANTSTPAPLQDSRYRKNPTGPCPYDAHPSARHCFTKDRTALGFQYFLLLPAALLLLRRDSPAAIARNCACGSRTLIRLATQLALSVPSASTALAGDRVDDQPKCGGSRAFAAIVLAANVWFLESSGWYHKDFAALTRSDAQKYYESERRSGF